MYATERQQQIEQLIATDGRVAVVELAHRFGVTTETVRRDLDQLERVGSVRRVHGGAVAPGRASTAESSISERAFRHNESKQAIGQRTVAGIDVATVGSIYLDAGTTVAAVAQQLAERVRYEGHVEVVTHSMAIAHILAGSTGVELTAIGGRVRGLTAAAVGAGTVQAIAGLRPDLAIVGTNGISAAFGTSTPDPDEAAVKRAIVGSARRVIVVADADKFDVELLFSFASLAEIDALVTDCPPPPALSAALRDAETEVWIA
ncbi:DeoR/GlpR family DNA-binding transcription regulator [Microbacterium sp.]|uniref:DeoR/GlpR family DNA-binding transcription regulator n=1 Tax=Microbacterium sp. TaxID=51671 RepID=UPI0039E28CBB